MLRSLFDNAVGRNIAWFFADHTNIDAMARLAFSRAGDQGLAEVQLGDSCFLPGAGLASRLWASTVVARLQAAGEIDNTPDDLKVESLQDVIDKGFADDPVMLASVQSAITSQDSEQGPAILREINGAIQYQLKMHNAPFRLTSKGRAALNLA